MGKFDNAFYKEEMKHRHRIDRFMYLMGAKDYYLLFISWIKFLKANGNGSDFISAFGFFNIDNEKHRK